MLLFMFVGHESWYLRLILESASQLQTNYSEEVRRHNGRTDTLNVKYAARGRRDGHYYCIAAGEGSAAKGKEEEEDDTGDDGPIPYGRVFRP